MKRFLTAAVATTALVAFGCDEKKNEMKAPTPEADKAAKDVSDKAVDTAKGVEKSVEGGTDTMKTGVDKMSDMAVNAEKLRGELTDIMGKAKLNLQEKKYDEAQKFVQQAKDLSAKLPAEAKMEVDKQLATLDTEIAAGKKLMMPAGH